VRVLGQLYLAALVVRDVMDPTHDPVNAAQQPRAVPALS
jgi:hypothetical protein